MNVVDISEIQKIRGFFKSIKVKKAKKLGPNLYATDENGNVIYFDEEPCLVIKLDNEHSFEEEIHTVIWDDVNQLIIGISTNNQLSTSAMIGTDSVKLPAVLGIYDYTEIQSIHVIMNKEAFDKYSEIMMDATKYAAAVGDKKVWNVQDQYTAVQKKNSFVRHFESADPLAIIPITQKPPQQDFSGKFEDKYGILPKE